MIVALADGSETSIPAEVLCMRVSDASPVLVRGPSLLVSVYTNSSQSLGKERTTTCPHLRYPLKYI